MAVAIVILLLYKVFQPLFDTSNVFSPTELILNRTESILQSAKYYKTANFSTEDPNAALVCGNALPKLLKDNQNQYSIVIVGIWGDYASPMPGGTGMTTAKINVVFPNGAKIEMQFYGYILDLCRLVQQGSEEF